MKYVCVIFYLCLFQSSSAYFIKTEKCLPNMENIRKLESKYGVQFLALNQNVVFNYDEDIVITNIAVNVIGIYLKNVKVYFHGRITMEENINDSIYTNFYVKNVNVRRSKGHIFGKNAYNCRVVDWNNSPIGTNSSTSELIIKSLTKICIEDSLCKQYNAIISHVFLNDEEKKSTVNVGITKQFVSQIRSSDRNAIANSDKQNSVICNVPGFTPKYNPQNTINAIFDFALSAVLTITAENYDGVMYLPYIEKDYKLAGNTGDFQAFNGTFIDLRALYRVKDLVFTHKKTRFMVATSFRLAKAKLTFPRYTLRYGYIKINGNLGVEIDGITVSTKVAVDYNASPCQIQLVDLTMDELGETKVDFTGLGWPLNGAVKLVIQYIIEHKIFEVAKDFAAAKLKEINCEKFRPSLDIFLNTHQIRNVKTLPYF